MGQCNPDRLHFADAGALGRILAEYVYSASGNPVVKKIGGNITNIYAYDELLNIKALKTEAEKQTLADNHYFYDGNGNQIRKEGLEGTTGYAYDGRNRLTEISYPSALGGYTEKLGYDAAGNRIRRETEQEITTYRYDNCNRLQELRREYKNAETSTAQPQIIRYTYDRQGNMLSEGEKKYSYDSFGRMVRAEIPVEHRRIHPLQENFRFRSTVTTEKACVMRWKKTAVSSSFYTTKTVKLWQKKPAMEQSQGISVDLESSVPTVRRQKLIITMYPMSREASHMSCRKMQRY